MFELTELNPRYAMHLAASGGSFTALNEQREQRTGHTAVIADDEGQLSAAEATLLLAGLGAILTSLWFTLTAIL